MKTLIRGLSAQGITVLLSSHQMADVEELCNRVAIINRGRILYEGDVAGLTRSMGTWYRLRASDLDAAQHAAAEFELADVTREDGELRFSADEELLERFMITLGKRRIGVRALIPQQATLEQLFFQLTEQDGGLGAPPAPADAGRRGGGVMPTFLTAYRWELRKLVSQKRTYLGLGRGHGGAAHLRDGARAPERVAQRRRVRPLRARVGPRDPARPACCSRRCGSSRS